MFFKQGLGRCKLGPNSMSGVIARKQVQKQIQLTALTASLRTILVIPRPTGTIIDTPKVTTRSQTTNKISNQPTKYPTSRISDQPKNQPAKYPTNQQNIQPTNQISDQPIKYPTNQINDQPNNQQTKYPTIQPALTGYWGSNRWPRKYLV